MGIPKTRNGITRSPREHPFGSEEAFFQAFMKMQSMVEEMYND
jgi:hypothetical protein